MKNILIQFLSKFNQLTEEQINELAGLMNVVETDKNSVIVKQDQHCDLCYFVLKGCLRQYIIQDGIEKTIAIYSEEEAVNYYTNQGDQQKADSYLTTVEDSVLLIGNPKKEHDVYLKFPALVEITRKMMEKDFGKTQTALSKFITSSPEQRYLNLLDEKPELLQRLPQHIIASYLGMTPESLSRIRKRIAKKNQAQ